MRLQKMGPLADSRQTPLQPAMSFMPPFRPARARRHSRVRYSAREVLRLQRNCRSIQRGVFAMILTGNTILITRVVAKEDESFTA